MTRWAILYTLLVGAATWSACLGTQEAFSLSGNNASKFRLTDTLLSPQFLSYVDEIRQNGSIPGISIGVVRLGENNEPIIQLASSGRKTEAGNGHDLTTDVCLCFVDVAFPHS